MSGSPSGLTFVDFGHIQGRTFNEVHPEEPGYVQWPRKVVRPRESGFSSRSAPRPAGGPFRL